MVRNVPYRLFQIVLVLVLFAGMEHRAYAYIDPGVGLATLQTVSATLFGVLYFLRRRIMKLFEYVGSRFGKSTKD
jgi:hypothetical protein